MSGKGTNTTADVFIYNTSNDSITQFLCYRGAKSVTATVEGEHNLVYHVTLSSKEEKTRILNEYHQQSGVTIDLAKYHMDFNRVKDARIQAFKEKRASENTNNTNAGSDNDGEK